MSNKILSFDISSVSTGWCFFTNDKLIHFDKITPTKNLDLSDKLIYTRNEVELILDRFVPTHVVIENGFGGPNIVTLKVLMQFAGIVKEIVKRKTGIIPYVMNNQTTKAYFKVRTKEQLYNHIINIYPDITIGFTFDSHNDITDAFAQGLCYYNTIINKIEIDEVVKDVRSKKRKANKTKCNKN